MNMNAFTAPAKGIDLGRTKSAEQIKKDAQRVNRFSDLARSTPNAGIRADQIRRGGR
jgi:hypothetical protein